MAERRMFAKSVVLADRFFNLQPKARDLYFFLGMTADDDGFVSGPRSIMRQTGATRKDLEQLKREGYLFEFESGVVVLRHWLQHNYIRPDRYKETACLNEKCQLEVDGCNLFILRRPNGLPPYIPDPIPDVIPTGNPG